MTIIGVYSHPLTYWYLGNGWEWMGCCGLLGWLLIVNQWISPEISLRLAQVSSKHMMMGRGQSHIQPRISNWWTRESNFNGCVQKNYSKQQMIWYFFAVIDRDWLAMTRETTKQNWDFTTQNVNNRWISATEILRWRSDIGTCGYYVTGGCILAKRVPSGNLT